MGCTLLVSTSGFDEVRDEGTERNDVFEIPVDVVGSEVSDASLDDRAPIVEVDAKSGSVWAGNGHRYQYVKYASALTWSEAKFEAEAVGGHLATITSLQEHDFVAALLLDGQAEHADAGPNSWGAWLGAYQPDPGANDGGDEPAGGWAWVTGEPWQFTRWNGGQPDNNDDEEHYVHILPSERRWNDIDNGGWGHISAIIVEFDE